MQSTFLVILAILTLASAAYAQLRLPALTASPGQAWVARLVLVLVGLGFGWTAIMKTAPQADAATQTLVFLAAFGVVHTPAAIILLLKTWQRRDSSLR